MKSWGDRPGCNLFATRAQTFRQMFEHLDRFDRPVCIVETGSAHDLDNWGGSGCSTLMFDKYVETHPGSRFWSVDMDEKTTKLCQGATQHARLVCGDSIAFLKMYASHPAIKIDLLYLDASDFVWHEPLLAQKHHLDELLAAMPVIRPDTLVAVDDSPILVEDFPYVEIGGKGGLVARYAAQMGAEQVFLMYQVGWTGMVRSDESEFVRGDAVNLKDLLMQASDRFHAGRVMEANTLFRLIYSLTSSPATKGQAIARGEACLFFAKMAVSAKRLGTALDWYQQAVKFDPEMAGYRLEMVSQVLRPIRHWDRAINEATLATRIEPDNVNAWRMLGGVNLWSERLEGAKAAFQQAMNLDPDAPEPKLDMMSAMFDDEPTEENYALVKKLAAEVVDTRFRGDALQALAFVAYRENRHEEAVALYDAALAAGVSEVPTCHWNKSLSLHALGRYREGWQEHTWRAQERTHLPIYVPVNRFSAPMWKGESAQSNIATAITNAAVEGKPPELARFRATSIHVHAEAGFGDNLCCARYLKPLVDRGYDVRFEAYANMVPLMQRSFPEVKVVPQAVDYPGNLGIEPFDYHLPVGEMPHVFGTEVDTVPWPGPYLKPDPELVESYRGKMPHKPGYRPGPWVGLCWSSGIREGLWIARYGKRKSMHYDDLCTLLRRALKVNFVSLQVGPERAQMRSTTVPWIADILPENPTWDDTAALLANLDLIISVDTAVVHLAGAMGKPVWLMNSAEPGSWHWMAERPGSPWNERSPWYPSVRIYRQRKVGEWADVVGRIADDLRKWTDS